MQRRAFLHILIAGPAIPGLLRPGAARAQATPWPDRPVRVVIPFPPGGAIDPMAQLLAPSLSEALGQPVLVENRAGVGGTIGTAATVQATDGHTRLIVSMAPSADQAVYPRLLYDSAGDFAPAVPIAVVPNLLVVPAGRPWRRSGRSRCRVMLRPSGGSWRQGRPNGARSCRVCIFGPSRRGLQFHRHRRRRSGCLHSAVPWSAADRASSLL
jgi:hypothetical protein